MKVFFLSSLAVSAAVVLSACAATAPAPETAAKPAPETVSVTFWKGFFDHPKGYLTRSDGVNAARYLPPPPQMGSEREATDIAIYHKTRALEGTTRWALAAQDTEVETPEAPFKAFECALGFRIAPEQAPVLAHLLGAVLPDVEIAQHEVKSTVRPRPYVREPLPMCISGAALSRSSSYPSGHSAIGFAWGLILTEIAPDKGEAIIRRSVAYGESRAVCGFHYISDVEAGRIMGAGLVAGLQSNAKFRSDIEVAKAEVAAIRETNPARPERCDAEDATLKQAAY
ncbi:MAG: phosphatase PAP2 family protein [Asticcacaulis sp.]